MPRMSWPHGCGLSLLPQHMRGAKGVFLQSCLMNRSATPGACCGPWCRAGGRRRLESWLDLPWCRLGTVGGLEIRLNEMVAPSMTGTWGCPTARPRRSWTLARVHGRCLPRPLGFSDSGPTPVSGSWAWHLGNGVPWRVTWRSPVQEMGRSDCRETAPAPGARQGVLSLCGATHLHVQGRSQTLHLDGRVSACQSGLSAVVLNALLFHLSRLLTLNSASSRLSPSRAACPPADQQAAGYQAPASPLLAPPRPCCRLAKLHTYIFSSLHLFFFLIRF